MKKKSGLLVMGVGLLAVCLCVIAGGYAVFAAVGAWIMQDNAINDPAGAAEFGQSIAEYTLPPGYQPAATTNPKAVILRPANTTASAPGLVFGLMQYPSYGDPAESSMEAILRERAGYVTARFTGIEESRSLVIQGQETPLITRAGDWEGQPIRLWRTTFHGRENAVMLVIVGPEEAWDEILVASFIESLR